MKKIHLFAIALVALVSSCNKIETAESGKMVPFTLRVELPFDYDTKAAITPSNTSDNLYMFDFTGQDQLQLSNSARYSTYQKKYRYYTLTRDTKDKLFHGNIDATENDANWFVIYPEESISIVNQDGTLDYVAKHLPLYGEQRNVTAGTTELSMTIEPMASVLMITDNEGGNNFRVTNNVQTAYVAINIKPLPADPENNILHQNEYRVTADLGSDSNPCNLLAEDTVKGGVYYVIIPSNSLQPTPLSVLHIYKVHGNELTELKSRDTSNPVVAGNIYTITINEE